MSEKVMLARKHLTPEVVAALKSKTTKSGFTLLDCVMSGFMNPDSSIGAYAGDADSYAVFAPFFDGIIADYHKYAKDGVHKRDMDADKLLAEDLDPEGSFIVSTRIRVGRNLADMPLAPAISKEQRLEVERQVSQALMGLEGELKGNYYKLGDMPETVRAQMVKDHFLFKQGDRFLEAAGCNRNWPEGRGIFHNAAKNFLVWVNEEDQLRIISMEQGGKVKQVFARLAQAVEALEERLKFSFDDHLGYHTSCPTNLGTAMRASVHVRLPKFSQTEGFQSLCADLRLSVRGIDGEHSESKGGVYDISNKQRLGISEVEAVNLLSAGVQRLIAEEKKLK